MKRLVYVFLLVTTTAAVISSPEGSSAWYDETHVAIAKVAGFKKWFNAGAADLIKIKAPGIENGNHYANNQPGVVVTPEMVLSQADRYDTPDDAGHLYGAIIASLREYKRLKQKGEYAEHHLALCAHYVGDLSMPLHNTRFDDFNKKHHNAMDGIISDEVLDNLDKISIYPIAIRSERDLASEIARIATLSAELGYRLEAENRLLTEEEAYAQISHSASLFKAILQYSGV